MAKLDIQSVGNSVVLKVKVVPGSSRTALCGSLDGMLKVKVAAAAEKGKANENLTAFLAEKLGIRKNQIKINSGLSSPIKQVQIEGLSPDSVTKILEKPN